jgi:hypothetical protein
MDDSAGADPTRPAIPNISKDLLDYLDWAYPPRCPHPDEPERVIWMNSGKRDLIDWLRRQYRLQESFKFF